MYKITEEDANTLFNMLNKISAISGVTYADISPLVAHLHKSLIKEESGTQPELAETPKSKRK